MPFAGLRHPARALHELLGHALHPLLVCSCCMFSVAAINFIECWTDASCLDMLACSVHSKGCMLRLAAQAA